MLSPVDPTLHVYLPPNPTSSFSPLRTQVSLQTEGLSAEEAALRRAQDEQRKSRDEPTPQPTAFLLHKLIAVGGFGEVWEATQVSLSRTVAVKRMRADLVSQVGHDEALMRAYERAFREEAIITASLEHPGIVPVHDLGDDEDGHPLMAMKLVRGRPWDQLIASDFQRPVAQFLSRHLSILVSVAQAVAFAHSRGVLHRDLKPSQVMVGEFGEVQLMDWGLGLRLEVLRQPADKVGDRGGPSGMIGAINPSGTAAFMAPEQTENVLHNLGTWTDVFLLGGTLYYLLTGRVPYGGTTTNAAFYQAANWELVPPQERAPHREIPTELARIALKAMARHPADRYASAEEFIEEINDYLSGATRRRESVGIARTVADVLAARPTAYRELDQCSAQLEQALILWPDNPRVHPLRQQAAALYAEAALANEDLTLARLHAERLDQTPQRHELLRRIVELNLEKKQAAERLRRALLEGEDLINFMVHDLHQALQPIGRLDLLEKVASKALHHFEQYREKQPEDSRILQQTATLRNIADVLRNRNKLDNAAHVLHEAIRLAEARLAALQEEEQRPPEDVLFAPPAPSRTRPWELDRAESMHRLGGVLYEQGELDRSLAITERTLEIRESLLKQTPDDHALQSAIAASHHQLGVSWLRKGKQDLALACFGMAVDLREERLRKVPTDVEEKTALATLLNSRTWSRRAVGDLDGALADMKRCLQLREELSTAAPENLTAQANLAWSLRSLALLQEDRLEFAAALDTFNSSLAICRRLSSADPANQSRLMELAFSLGGVARNLFSLGLTADAAPVYEEAVGLQRTAYQADPSNTRQLRDLTYNLVSLSAVFRELGRAAKALQLADEAAGYSAALPAAMASTAPILELRARIQLQRGACLESTGRADAARQCWEEAASLMKPLQSDSFPAVQEETYAKALLMLGRREEAAPIVEKLLRKGWKGPEFITLARKAGLLS